MKTITLPLLILMAAFSSTATAQIYKTIDKNGNVVFTDIPSRSQPSEKVILRPITELPPQVISAPFSKTPADKTAANHFSYDVFTITSPANDSTVRNSGTFTIKVSTKPTLDRTHKVRFSINGKAITGPRRSLNYQVKNLERGTHQITAELLNSSGKVVQSTDSTVHVQRSFVRPSDT